MNEVFVCWVLPSNVFVVRHIFSKKSSHSCSQKAVDSLESLVIWINTQYLDMYTTNQTWMLKKKYLKDLWNWRAVNRIGLWLGALVGGVGGGQGRGGGERWAIHHLRWVPTVGPKDTMSQQIPIQNLANQTPPLVCFWLWWSGPTSTPIHFLDWWRKAFWNGTQIWCKLPRA